MLKEFFSESDSTIWSYNFYTITEEIHDTFPTYRIDYLPEKYNEHLLRLTNLALEENNEVMNDLKIIQ